MRLTQTVNLDKSRAVTVRELRVSEVRNVIGKISALEGLGVAELLGERFPEIAGLLSDCIEPPKGEGLEDLSFSELETVMEAFKEVNAAFFRLTGINPAGQGRPDTARPPLPAGEGMGVRAASAGETSTAPSSA